MSDTQYQQIQKWARLSIHDNNNIINNILLALHELKNEENELDNDVRECCFRIIEDNVKKINNPFLAISHSIEGEEETTPLLQELSMLRDEVLILASKGEKDVHFDIKNIEPFHKIRFIKNHFEFICEELINNAFQFAAEGTIINVVNEIIGDNYILTVENFKNHQDEIEPENLLVFYSSKQKGNGLGLHKINASVKEMKGDFSFEKNENNWKVRVTIPLYID